MEQTKKLEVKNLQISFRTQEGILKAVRDISFDLYKGETLAIVGESGSGKSVTSKAIIGILAGNSIIEGGEILYDGQDLLKIDEENFHKIRGDKISMIFQDPLSSLNPIMKIGHQLTEAMILNGKARQKNARANFNDKLTLLEEAMNNVKPNEKAKHAKICKELNDFTIVGTEIETSYNFAHERAIALKDKIDEITFLVSKNQKINTKKEVKGFIVNFKNSLHQFVVSENEEFTNALVGLQNLLKLKTISFDELNSACTPVLEIINAGLVKEKPDFFALGFYKYKNHDFDPSTIKDVKEFDAMSNQYLNDNFLNEFIEIGAQALIYNHDIANQNKVVALEHAKNVLNYIETNGVEIEKSFIYAEEKQLVKEVEQSRNKISVHKKSIEYSFPASFKHELDRFYKGKEKNPVYLKKYEKSKAKYQKLVDAGKQPTWKVVPPYLTDLELTCVNLKKILTQLINRYEKTLANEQKGPYKAKENMISLIEYMKEEASRFTFEMTPALAKVRALELMKEVGIPEPQIRFNQYPFEFSGGMRQRIVIAIALSANPDILICDEPTTALDVTIQSQILELINKIKAERNLSVIFITHDLGVVANMADRIAVMYAGKIVEYGTSKDIFYDPRHPYTWALLSSTPDLETKEKLDAIPGTPPNMIYPPVGDAFAERNKYALDIDFEMQPPLFEVTDTHFAATWLLHPNAPKVELPKIIKERIERMKKEANEL